MEDIVLPSKPNTVPMISFVKRIGNQDYIVRSSPQCPKHLYVLTTERGPGPDITLVIEACPKCVIEAETETKQNK